MSNNYKLKGLENFYIFIIKKYIFIRFTNDHKINDSGSNDIWANWQFMDRALRLWQASWLSADGFKSKILYLKKKSYHEHDGLHNRRARTRVRSLHIFHSRHLRCGDRSCVRTHRHDRRMVPPGSRTPDRTHSGGLNRWGQGHPPVWGQLGGGRGRRLRLRCRVLGGELGTGSWLAWTKKCIVFFSKKIWKF